MIKLHKAAEEYRLFFENLSRAQVGLLQNLCDPSIIFEDPFQRVQGVEALRKIFYHMFDNFDAPKFRVLDVSLGQKNNVYMKWVFSAKRKGKMESFEFEGVSEIIFNESGKAIAHKDYWDAGATIYESIPVLGFFIRKIKAKITS